MSLFIIKNKILKKYQKVFIFIIISQIYIVSSWSSWWQGASYGGRMFPDCCLFFAIGLAEGYKKLDKKIYNAKFLIYISIISFSLINIISIINFLLTN